MQNKNTEAQTTQEKPQYTKEFNKANYINQDLNSKHLSNEALANKFTDLDICRFKESGRFWVHHFFV